MRRLHRPLILVGIAIWRGAPFMPWPAFDRGLVAEGREQDRGQKPRFPQKLHEVRVDHRVASGAMRDENSYSFMQIAITFASRRYQLSAEIMSRMFSNTYEQASVTRAQS